MPASLRRFLRLVKLPLPLRRRKVRFVKLNISVLKRSTRHLKWFAGEVTIKFGTIVDNPVDRLRSTINLRSRDKSATLSQGVENLPLLEESLSGIGQAPVPGNIVQLLHDRGKCRILLRCSFRRVGQHLSLSRVIVPERRQRRFSIEMKHNREAHGSEALLPQSGAMSGPHPVFQDTRGCISVGRPKMHLPEPGINTPDNASSRGRAK